MLPLGHMGITLFLVRTAACIVRLRPIDYKIVLAGSLLPDLIDKPLGILFSPNHHLFVKSFGHSLFFLVFLYGVSKLLRSNRRKHMLRILWLCAVIHDIFDLMWLFPKVIFWPMYIPALPKIPYEPWGQVIHFYGFPMRQIVTLEVVGGCILLVFFIMLALDNKLSRFLKTGALSSYTSPDSRASKKPFKDN